eukprot:scaffold196540_cov22-Prasinocladus_malaysianus.AAC.2
MKSTVQRVAVLTKYTTNLSDTTPRLCAHLSITRHDPPELQVAAPGAEQRHIIIIIYYEYRTSKQIYQCELIS